MRIRVQSGFTASRARTFHVVEPIGLFCVIVNDTMKDPPWHPHKTTAEGLSFVSYLDGASGGGSLSQRPCFTSYLICKPIGNGTSPPVSLGYKRSTVIRSELTPRPNLL